MTIEQLGSFVGIIFFFYMFFLEWPRFVDRIKQSQYAIDVLILVVAVFIVIAGFVSMILALPTAALSYLGLCFLCWGASLLILFLMERAKGGLTKRDREMMRWALFMFLVGVVGILVPR